MKPLHCNRISTSKTCIKKNCSLQNTVSFCNIFTSKVISIIFSAKVIKCQSEQEMLLVMKKLWQIL